MSFFNIGIAIFILIGLILPIVGVWLLYRIVRSMPKVVSMFQRRHARALAREREIERIKSENRLLAGPDLYEGINTDDIIALNRQTCEVVTGTLLSPIIVPFSMIVDAEVIREKVTLTQTNKAQAASAILADDIYWSTRAIQKAVTADRLSTELLGDVSIKLTIDNWNYPVHMFCLLRSTGVDLHSQDGATAIATIDKIHAQLEQIIRANGAAASSAAPRLASEAGG